MAKNKDIKCVSETLAIFLSSIDRAKHDYEWNTTEMKRMDDLTQDYLHAMELEDLNYKERAKLATKLSECRKQRRKHKDMVTVLEPLMLVLNDEKGKQTIKALRETLGKTRKIESNMECRRYYPRVKAEGGE